MNSFEITVQMSLPKQKETKFQIVYLCYSKERIIESTPMFLNQPQHKLGQLCATRCSRLDPHASFFDNLNLDGDSNPPRQREDCYQSTTLSPSHHTTAGLRDAV